MEIKEKKELGWNPSRVLFGLSRIGYNTSSALCDIVDNSFGADAKNIQIIAVKRDSELAETAKNNIKEYCIIDDGKGMSEEEILEALKLGADDTNYETNSLSKFGLGLKSASFSQGDILEVISSKDGESFEKFCVSMPEIEKHKQYFAYRLKLTKIDKELIKKYISKSGTIIRIGEVRQMNHPSYKITREELEKKLGIIYYYKIQDEVKIFLNDILINPYDVLHIDEANSNGESLDPNTWDGKSVRWLEKPKQIILDLENQVKAQIEATQLPHPPRVFIEDKIPQNETRKKYQIEAGNYGFYVYRNGRLISWAEKFGIIPQDQDLYSFRGRVLIDETADDALNIDVKKSSITLSESSLSILDTLSNLIKKNSKDAWNSSKAAVSIQESNSSTEKSNEIAERTIIDLIPPGSDITEKEAIEVATKVSEKQRKKIKDHIKSVNQIEEVDETTLEDFNKNSNPLAEYIYRVPTLPDNVLWSPFYNGEKVTVQINLMHRFAQQVYQNNERNRDMHIIIDLFMHNLAASELHMYNVLTKKGFSIDQIDNIFLEYRLTVSDILAKMCRDSSNSLPPYDNN